jgi:hypothetical protein
MWVHCFTPQPKQSTIELCHKGSPPPKKFKTQLSAGKCVWDSEGVIHVDFLQHDVTVNAQYYSKLLHNDMHQAVRMKRPGKLSKIIILLHDSTYPHMSNLMNVTVAAMGSEIMNHPSYRSDLVPSDLRLLGPMQVHLGGQKFQTVDELKCNALNWLCSRDETIYAAGISSMPE